jgi:hypothetical protein
MSAKPNSWGTMNTTGRDFGARGKLVWSGRPSVSIYYAIYGIIALILIAILTFLEFWVTRTSIGAGIFPRALSFRGIVVPYPVEVATVAVILLVYLAEVVHLAILRASKKYSLYEDGLYIDLGIVNLENTYLSAMAFSDARLFRTVSLRLAKRGNIIVDLNDERHLQLELVDRPAVVQALIRRTLGHPTVRVEGYQQPMNESFSENEARDDELHK